jgi:aldose 1-epimerase
VKQVTISTPFITLIVLDFGAIIQKLLVKDKDGNSTNVVVGKEFPSDYPFDTTALGASMGRYAGRISNGGFVLDRATYPLYQQKGVHLHGGKRGFHKRDWTIEKVHHGREPYVTLSYSSKHLEEGYPGNLTTVVTYKLVNNTLHITYEATTDRTTVVNLTNHSYFRLDDESKIDAYRLQLNCSKMVETLADHLPSGKVVTVTETPFDFLREKEIGNVRLNTPFVIDSNLKAIAKLASKKSGIALTVKTNQPAVVVYTPPEFPAICFETQNYPDAPNQKNFPSSVLRRGENYMNTSAFTFDLI